MRSVFTLHPCLEQDIFWAQFNSLSSESVLVSQKNKVVASLFVDE